VKTIPIEQLNEHLTQALEQQNEHEAIGLTKDAGTVAWVVRVPEAMKDSEADVNIFAGGRAGQILVVLQAKHPFGQKPEATARTPVFGAGRRTLTIVREDEDHLKGFQEYME